jgi:hypothetical protein
LRYCFSGTGSQRFQNQIAIKTQLTSGKLLSPSLLPTLYAGFSHNFSKAVSLMTDKDLRGAAVPSQRPRSPRVPVEFALGVEGRTPSGQPFKVQAQAIKISRAGATVLVDAEVALGSILKLTPPFGRELDAEVNGVWTDPIDGRRRIGVKLLDEDGWFAE